MTNLRSFLALFVSCFALVGLPACSSDAAPEPEPTIETPGAFVAFDPETTGALTLIRTLDRLQLPQETVLFVTFYDVDPMSWDEATELAKGHDLPIRIELELLTEGPLTMKPYRVVWFRTLSHEEKERVP